MNEGVRNFRRHQRCTSMLTLANNRVHLSTALAREDEERVLSALQVALSARRNRRLESSQRGGGNYGGVRVTDPFLGQVDDPTEVPLAEFVDVFEGVIDHYHDGTVDTYPDPDRRLERALLAALMPHLGEEDQELYGPQVGHLLP